MTEPPVPGRKALSSAVREPASSAVGRIRQPRVTGADREFLPAALEILETPPAPRSTVFMLSIYTFILAAVAWSFFGKIDVHATAWGRIEALGGSKLVQPLESGKIAAIHVVEGEDVRAGQLLIELDNGEAAADAMEVRDALAAARAEWARRTAVIEVAKAFSAGDTQNIAIDFDRGTPSHIRIREQKVLDAERIFMRDTIVNFDRQVAQRVASVQRLEMSIENQVKAIQTSEERVDVRESSIKLNVGTKINLFDARESLLRSQAQLASDRGQQLEMKAAIAEIESQRSKLLSNIVNDNEGRLAEISRRIDELVQKAAKAEIRLGRTALSAPIDGIVQQMSVATIGQVVTTGQQLLTIAPQQTALQAEVFIANTDIGFVHIGQHVEIKLDAFPFTRFGTVPARVVRIGLDALEEQEAKRRLANATAVPQSPSTPSPGRQQTFFFPVKLKLERAQIDAGERQAPLLPGMTIVAEIKTDRRRIVDYLISPLAKLNLEAMRER